MGTDGPVLPELPGGANCVPTSGRHGRSHMGGRERDGELRAMRKAGGSGGEKQKKAKTSTRPPFATTSTRVRECRRCVDACRRQDGKNTQVRANIRGAKSCSKTLACFWGGSKEEKRKCFCFGLFGFLFIFSVWVRFGLVIAAASPSSPRPPQSPVHRLLSINKKTERPLHLLAHKRPRRAQHIRPPLSLPSRRRLFLIL